MKNIAEKILKFLENNKEIYYRIDFGLENTIIIYFSYKNNYINSYNIIISDNYLQLIHIDVNNNNPVREVALFYKHDEIDKFLKNLIIEIEV